MATIKTAIQVQDGVSNAFRSMNATLNSVVNSFEAVQNASGNAIDNSSIQAAREEIARIVETVNRVENEVKEVNAAQQELNEKFKKGHGAADQLGSKIKSMVGAFVGVHTIKMAVEWVKDTLNFANIQTEAETKIQTVMNQRWNGGEVAFQAVMDVTALEQTKGVVGDEVQLGGAQQLATFLNSTEALTTLIPAMNNLAVQQNGVNVTSENMIGLGNMMGKVMQGQTSALTRVGITFSEAEENALKYGNEQERAAMLAQIITNNVGEMNEAMADTPFGKIAQFNNNWGDIKEVIGGQLYPAVLNFFDTINNNMPQIQALMFGLSIVIKRIVEVLTTVVVMAGEVAKFFIDNWLIIEPIVVGVAGALLFYAFCLGVVAVATWVADGKAKKFFVTLLTNPLFWLALLIGIVVAYIYKWVQSVGGIKIAWLITMNAIKTSWDITKIALTMGIFGIMNAFNKFQLSFMELSTNIQNFMGHMKAGTLMILQNMVNGAIDIINDFISTINKIPGVSIDTIATVTFGTTAELENKVAKMERNIELAYARKEFDERVSQRASLMSEMINDAETAAAQRNLEIEGLQSQAEIEAEATSVVLDENSAGAENLEDIAGNTGAIADSMEIVQEELKYLREATAREAVNRFTTAEIKVEFTSNATINDGRGYDGVMDEFKEKLREAVDTSAEGSHVYV